MGAPQAAGPSFIVTSPHSGQFFDTSIAAQVFTFNGKLYAVQNLIGSGGANINGMGVCRSNDGGSTWTLLDSANGPNSGFGAAFFDAPNNQLIFALVTITFPQAAQPIFLKNFNLSTETWGANYATGGPNAVTVVQQCFKRPDATIFAIYDFGASNPGGTTRLRGAYWNGTVWSSSIDLGANALGVDPTGAVSVANTGAAMDATGNIHIAFTTPVRANTFYQQFTTANALGSTHQFTGITFSTGLPVIGSVLISGSNILISTVTTSRQNNTLLVGTPLASPVWSTVSPSGLSSPAGLIDFAGPLATDGTNLVWMLNFVDVTKVYDYYQLAKSTDHGLTWTILADNTTSPFFYNFAPGGSPLAPNTDPTFGTSAPVLAILSPAGAPTAYGFTDVNQSLLSIQVGYFMNSEPLGAAPPAAVANLKITLRGVKRRPATAPADLQESPEPVHIKRVL